MPNKLSPNVAFEVRVSGVAAGADVVELAM
jgi:hypothetical protein